MSSKPAKKKSEGKESPRTHTETAPVRPTGRVPTATVEARHGMGMVTRAGKGFSLAELSDAGIVPRMASKWGARLDGRRRSMIQANVNSLKNWGSHAVKAERTMGEVKKLEEEVVKVEKKVKKGAAEVKKEIVKIESMAKKETTKARRKVKKKAGKPTKARRKKKK
ncbi:MAG: 60S ribosomal protein L13 [Thaumarchaeota archaeon]|nr:60S ribosomal protein L13 [Nitrososphaerota archaeon]